MKAEAPINKPALRSLLRKRRKALALAHPDAPTLAAAKLPIELLRPFTIVAGYQPMGSELDPGPLLQRFADFGATIVLPVATSSDQPLVFQHADGQAYAAPDIVIAPLFAFDRNGGRLGQGGGHYDRTLEGLRARSPVFVIGLAFAGQQIDAVPREPHDQWLDAILTEISYTSVRKDI